MSEIKLLLVDDEEGFVTTLAERLGLRGIEPRVALDGARALELIEEDEPEVMVLDLRMPGMSGTEVLREVKSRWPAIRVIMLTGHGSDAERETCMGLGAAAYHKKPLDIEELLDSIRAASRTPGRGGRGGA
jgi:DNA-binding response OmpR family regulator